MKNYKLLLSAVMLVSSLFTTVYVDAQERKGPPQNGEHKGPPPGGKHSPEQTETLKDMSGYKIGDTATDFKLKNVDNALFSMSDIKNAKGYIVVFTCNECPFAKMYEDRLIALHNKYASKGYSVIAINPNVNETSEKENFLSMQKKASEKKFPFVYLADTGQRVLPLYGALRTPHVFLLDKDFIVQYIGAIDDNAKNESEVKEKYVENAIQALENGEKPKPNFTKAIGCPVKRI